MEGTGEVKSGRGEQVNEGGQPRASAMVRGIEVAKQHPLVVVAVSLVAVPTFFISAWGLIAGALGVLDDQANPHRELYAQIDDLKLDVTPEYVEGVLGSPDFVVDPEADCEGCDALSLRIYHLERDVTVRALFEGSTLGMFLVTRVDPDVNPEIRWQGSARGALGDVSFAEASALNGDEMFTPTDVAFWPGAQRITYIEVFALGAPGNYEGFILGHSTEGVSDTPFDITDAQVVADAFEAPSSHALPAAGVEFRRMSSPNTFGAFRDDGLMGELVRDADFVNSIQIAGTQA